MPNKLKNLKITKVDFVDEGANPDANIVLVKQKDGAAEPDAQRGVIQRMIDWFTGTVEKHGESVEKGAETFGEALGRQNLDKITDDMWNLCYALNSSLCSILADEELDAAQKQAAMLESVEEFTVKCPP